MPSSSPFTSTPVFYDSDSDSETPSATKNVDSNGNRDTLTVTRSADSTEKSDLIPKPDGEAGRPGRGGYNLQTFLKWTPRRWKEVQVSTA
jgi:hypothetical protein